MKGKSKSRDYGGNTCLRTVRFRIHGLRRQCGNGGTTGRRRNSRQCTGGNGCRESAPAGGNGTAEPAAELKRPEPISGTEVVNIADFSEYTKKGRGANQ